MIITDCENSIILQSKILSSLLKGIISKYNGGCHCINCLQLFKNSKSKKIFLKIMTPFTYEIAKKYVKMPEIGKNILKYDLGEISMKIPFAFYADIKSLFEKIDEF